VSDPSAVVGAAVSDCLPDEADRGAACRIVAFDRCQITVYGDCEVTAYDDCRITVVLASAQATPAVSGPLHSEPPEPGRNLSTLA
jgi:hypothetical protein